jgi:hypothetical protein
MAAWAVAEDLDVLEDRGALRSSPFSEVISDALRCSENWRLTRAS